MKFDKVIGHSHNIEILDNMIKSGDINHALLFMGISGIGKKYTALSFAKTLLCNEENSCGNCPSCNLFEARTHPDFFLIKPEDGVIKKKVIEELNENASIKPYESKYKIYMIDGFEKVTKEGQNAFLKTLENPPSYLKIILMSSNKSLILPTILSRCQELKFNSLDKLTIVEYLHKNYDISVEKANFAAEFSNGSIGTAIKLISSEEFNEMRNKSIDVLDRVIKGDLSAVLSNTEFFENNKGNIDQIFDLYLLWARDIYLYKLTEDPTIIINKDKLHLIKTESFLTMDAVDNIINSVMEASKNIHDNLNYMLNIEMLFISIREECK